MEPTAHPNSKKVTIFRAGSFLSRAQGKDIEDHFADSKVSIGSYWKDSSSVRVGTGMEFWEENLLMPNLVDADINDRDFRKKVTDYFVDLDIKLPYKGLILEIGLEKDNLKPVSKDNMPLNQEDYVKYRVARMHPFMASNKEAAESNPQYQFYIFDKDATADKNKKKLQEKDTALKLFYTIEQDPDKVRQLLLLLGTDPNEYSGSDADSDRRLALRNLAEAKSATFVETYNKEDLATRYWITAMIRSKILMEVGTSVRISSGSKTILGRSMEEAIAYFTDEENEDVVMQLKALQQEADQKLPEKAIRRTKKLNEV